MGFLTKTIKLGGEKERETWEELEVDLIRIKRIRVERRTLVAMIVTITNFPGSPQGRHAVVF